MNICEYCKDEHDGSFGTGRFCCLKCAMSFSSNFNKEERLSKVSSSLKGRNDFIWNKGRRKWVVKCKKCNKEFYRNGKYCSIKCMGEDRKSEEWSSLQKTLYATNQQQVGGGNTSWYNYKNIRVQGTYELRVCRVLDFFVEEERIKSWEYTKDRFSYVGLDKNIHSYLVDFKIFNSDKSFYYLEVKGYKRDIDELKWKALRDTGNTLVVWYEEDIIENEKDIINNDHVVVGGELQ